MEKKRCFWVDEKSPVYIEYHDSEWGQPVHDDQKLYEMFLLETFQAGLSWITILRKREAFRTAFDSFDVQKIAAYSDEKIDALLQNDQIIRNRNKIRAAVTNAQIFIQIQTEYGSFSNYLWGFSGGKVIINNADKAEAIPVKTELSDSISKDLKKRGMRFVGSVTIYAYLQAIGIVNDHEKNCFCYPHL
ncbi:DNA-3-methyladenine glycosylase I [Novisyntrophococcus fermenticellae]|uniref:DNA-3-methyladenine glycosylase I n=1 Tax=Novisyntrophococcus fermenticellae TaxID=2068655 RepID=UPI001E3A1666|nr:DNA-3-methyladenine glycosylase I [Novisyntrophococcus fermenticellae]